MRHGKAGDRRCSYVVVVDRPSVSIDGVRALAEHLAMLGVTGCEVVIADRSPDEVFQAHRRVLRWVGRHVAVSRPTDSVRAAVELAGCEKVIVAPEDVRYSAADVESMCQLLEAHDVIEPQQYLSPLPWWGGIEAGRMLVQRGLERFGNRSTTYAFRATAVRNIRGVDSGSDHAIRRFALRGADVHAAGDLFVRRTPPEFSEWVRDRARQADEDFAIPVRSVLFLALLPLAVSLAILGGLRAAGGFAGALAFASTALAIRGRIGASAFYPLRAALLAPVWVLDRSISVYWALFRRFRLQASGGRRQAVVAMDSISRERSSAESAVRANCLTPDA